MALVKLTLKTALYNTLKSQYDGDLTSEQDTKLNSLAADLATCFDDYIKSATIIIPAGQVVVCAPYPGATTAPSPPAQIT